jgi:DNA-binding NarL/FixJ family response regulator
MQEEKIKILIADNQTDIRSALSLMVEEALEVTVVAEASDAVELMRRTKEIQPDIVVVDWELPGMSALRGDLADVLKLHRANVVVVALSSRPDSRDQALAAGVDSYVCKGDGPQALLAVLRQSISKCREGGSE